MLGIVPGRLKQNRRTVSGLRNSMKDCNPCFCAKQVSRKTPKLKTRVLVMSAACFSAAMCTPYGPICYPQHYIFQNLKKELLWEVLDFCGYQNQHGNLAVACSHKVLSWSVLRAVLQPCSKGAAIKKTWNAFSTPGRKHVVR